MKDPSWINDGTDLVIPVTDEIALTVSERFACELAAKVKIALEMREAEEAQDPNPEHEPLYEIFGEGDE